MTITDVAPSNDPAGVWPFLVKHFPVVAEMLLYTDEFWSDLIWQDTGKTISWHIACMRCSSNPISRFAARRACVALNLLSPNHCDAAIRNEGECPCQ